MSVSYLCEYEIMATLFVLNWAQCNDHLPEYPKGTQVSCKGVFTYREAAVAAMYEAVDREINLWNMEDEDGGKVSAFIDEDESDSEQIVISILEGDVVSIYRIQRMLIS